MPTINEIKELKEKCTWTWTTKNGKEGYKVTSKSNGNSVFLPASGYREGSSLSLAGSNGRYWSSSLHSGDGYNAYGLGFGSGFVGWNYRSRYYGRSVRPVCQ